MPKYLPVSGARVTAENEYYKDEKNSYKQYCECGVKCHQYPWVFFCIQINKKEASTVKASFLSIFKGIIFFIIILKTGDSIQIQNIIKRNYCFISKMVL